MANEFDDFEFDPHAFDFLKDIWGGKEKGAAHKPMTSEDFKAAAVRPITQEDITYLLSRYPFIQIVDSLGDSESDALNIVATHNDWSIHDWGDAMAASPGRFVFGGKGFKEDEAGGGSEMLRGTIVQQAYDISWQLVEMAMEREWSGIDIIDGSREMQWAVWMAAEEFDMPVNGFEATEEEEAKRIRVMEQLKQRLAESGYNLGPASQ